MPDVRGQDGNDAEAFLESEYGLNVEQTETSEACIEPPGAVCDQDPAPGELVAEGESATLFIAPGGADLNETKWAGLAYRLGLA
jgi:beta-lactam-binding protein with PASTA domain